MVPKTPSMKPSSIVLICNPSCFYDENDVFSYPRLNDLKSSNWEPQPSWIHSWMAIRHVAFRNHEIKRPSGQLVNRIGWPSLYTEAHIIYCCASKLGSLLAWFLCAGYLWGNHQCQNKSIIDWLTELDGHLHWQKHTHLNQTNAYSS